MNALLYFGLAGMEVASGEVIETRANVSRRRIELVTDSGGPGVGAVGWARRIEWEIHGDDDADGPGPEDRGRSAVSALPAACPRAGATMSSSTRAARTSARWA